MRVAPKSIAGVRRMACVQRGCQHDLALSDDLDSVCPNGLWGTKEPNYGRILVLNQSGLSASNLIPKTDAIPYSEWPLWAKSIELLSIGADTGVGDTVARIVGAPVSDVFKSWYRQVFGCECGCATRQSDWNRIYPYKKIANSK